MAGGEGGVELGKEVVAVELRASGSRGSTRGTPAKKLRGSRRTEHQWRQEIETAARSHRSWSPARFRHGAGIARGRRV